MQLSISVDSCTPAGTKPVATNDTAVSPSSLCSSCVWAVLGSMTAGYYRLSDGSAFFSTDSPDEILEVTAFCLSCCRCLPARITDSHDLNALPPHRYTDMPLPAQMQLLLHNTCPCSIP